MALDFNEAFGKNKIAAATASKEQRPMSQYWLNIGYVAEGAGKDGEDTFVSLPTGIALDSMERLKTNSSNQEFAQLQAARNDLLDQILTQAKALAPGEEMVFNLQLQLRRVREEQQISVGADNKFTAAIQFPERKAA